MYTDNELLTEVREWLASHWKNDLPTKSEQFGSDPRSQWLAKLVEARWAVPRWPVEWFGRGLADDQARIIEQEFAAVGAPGAGRIGSIFWPIPRSNMGHPRFKETSFLNCSRAVSACACFTVNPALALTLLP